MLPNKVFNSIQPVGNVIRLRKAPEPPENESDNRFRGALTKHLREMSDDPEAREVIELLRDIRKHYSHPEMCKVFEKNDSVLAREAKDDSDDILELLAADYMRCNHLGKNDNPTELQQFEFELHVRHMVMATMEDFREAMTIIRGEVTEITKKRSGITVKGIDSEKIQRARYNNKRVNASFSLLEGLCKLQGKNEEVILTEIGGADSFLNDMTVESLGEYVEALAERYLEALSQTDFKVQVGLSKIACAKRDLFLERKTEDVLDIPQHCHNLQAILTCDADVVSSLTKLWLETDYGNIEYFARLVDQVVTEAQCYLALESGTDIPFVPVEWEPRPQSPESKPRFPTIPAGPPPPSGRPLNLPSFKKTIPPPSVSEPSGMSKETVRFDEKTLKPEEEAYVFENRLHTIKPGSLTSIIFAMSGATIEVPNGAKLDLYMASDNTTIRLQGPNAHVRIQEITHTCKSLRILGSKGEVLTGGPNLDISKKVAEKLKA